MVALIDTDVMASIQAQILNGMDKSKSRHVVDEETSRFWDNVQRQTDEIHANGGQVDIVRD